MAIFTGEYLNGHYSQKMQELFPKLYTQSKQEVFKKKLYANNLIDINYFVEDQNKKISDVLIHYICICNYNKSQSITIDMANCILQIIQKKIQCFHFDSIILIFQAFIEYVSSIIILQESRNIQLTSTLSNFYDKIIDKVFTQMQSNHFYSYQQIQKIKYKKSFLQQQIQLYNQKKSLPSVDQLTTRETLSPLYKRDQILMKYLSKFIQNIIDQGIFNNSKYVVDYFQETGQSYCQKLNLFNQQNYLIGKFGWCYMCRKSANNYCKQTKVPICSKQCKKHHLQQLKLFNKACIKQQNYYQICLNIWRFLIYQLSKTQANNSQAIVVKQKNFILNKIYKIIKQSGYAFWLRKDFFQILRQKLIPLLTQLCLSFQITLNVISFNIITLLMLKYPQQLKFQFQTIINHVVLYILRSNNSSYKHKYNAIKVFINQKFIKDLLKQGHIMLQIYLNYDCKFKNTNLIEQLISILSKIYLGKYNLPQYKNNLSEENHLSQNQQLGIQQITLNTLVQITQGLNKYINKVQIYQKFNFQDQIKKGKDSSFAQQMKLKNQINQAVKLFNIKPSKAIQYLRQKFLQLKNTQITPKFIAQFINYSSLSKQKIGEFFGSQSQFNQQVLQIFTKNLQFQNFGIVQSLRYYFKTFTLPGQSQQIDRVIQKFSKAYYQKQQKKLLKSSKTVYLLSYSLIILQTSLHSPLIKDKIKLVDFQKSLKDINQGQSLSKQYINELYYDIANKPLGLHSIQQRKNMIEQAQRKSQKERLIEYNKQSQNVIKKIKKKKNKNTGNQFKFAYGIQYFPNLVKYIWNHLLASLILLLENTEIQKIQNGLFWLQNMINLSNQMHMKQQLKYLLALLFKMTGINQQRQRIQSGSTSSFQSTFSSGSFTDRTKLKFNKQLKQKNFISLECFFRICINYGNCIGNEWKKVIEFLSSLDYLLVGPIKQKSQIQVFFYHKKFNRQSIQNNIQKVNIDRIFSNSQKLNHQNLIDFISALTTVSQQELNDSIYVPRIFCLQRIIQVAEYNIFRFKQIWHRIWFILKSYFQKVGCHPNTNISLYVIDSFKQLGIKFLKHGETPTFTFQQQFLQPFVQIYCMNNKNPQIKQLIISCLGMLTVYHYNISSGYKTIFLMFDLALKQNYFVLQKRIFDIMNKITYNFYPLLNHLEIVCNLYTSLSSIPAFTLESFSTLNKCLIFLTQIQQFQLINKLYGNILNSYMLQTTKQNRQQVLKRLFALWSVTKIGIQRKSESLQKLHQIQRYVIDKLNCKPKSLLTVLISGITIFQERQDLKFHLKFYENCLNSLNSNFLLEYMRDFKQFIFKQTFTQEDLRQLITSLTKWIQFGNNHQIIQIKSRDDDFNKNLNQLRDYTVMSNFQNLLQINFHIEKSKTKSINQIFILKLACNLLNKHQYYQYKTSEQIQYLFKIVKQSNKISKQINSFIYLRMFMSKNGFLQSNFGISGFFKQQKYSLNLILIIGMNFQKESKQISFLRYYFLKDNYYKCQGIIINQI